MHSTIKLDTQTNPNTNITTQFQAALLVVQNLTAESILCRVGALDVPTNVETSDIYVAPFSSITYSVSNTQFAFGFGEPAVSPIPSGSPTTAIITLSVDEPVPTFSGMPITNVNANISGSVDATISDPISLSTGTEVGLVAGTEVTLPNGQVVNLPAGTQVGLESGTTVDSNVTNENLPIASSYIYQGQIGPTTVGQQSVALNLPHVNGATAIMIVSSAFTNNYQLLINDSASPYSYNELSQPQEQVKIAPIASLSNSSFTVAITENDNSKYYSIYQIIGSLPIISQPFGGYERVQTNIADTGFIYQSATIAANSAETTLINGPSIDPSFKLVIDSINLEAGMQGTRATAGTCFSAFYIRAVNGNAIEYVSRCWNPNSIVISGPIYLTSDYLFRFTTYNNSSSPQVMNVSCAYHYELQS